MDNKVLRGELKWKVMTELGRQNVQKVTLENIMSIEKERNMLYRAVYNPRTRLPADIPAIFITTVLCGV